MHISFGSLDLSDVRNALLVLGAIAMFLWGMNQSSGGKGGKGGKGGSNSSNSNSTPPPSAE